MVLSPDAKERLAVVLTLAKTVFHYGFVPTVIYLGFKKGPEVGMPPFSLASLLWQ